MCVHIHVYIYLHDFYIQSICTYIDIHTYILYQVRLSSNYILSHSYCTVQIHPDVNDDHKLLGLAARLPATSACPHAVLLHPAAAYLQICAPYLVVHPTW